MFSVNGAEPGMSRVNHKPIVLAILTSICIGSGNAGLAAAVLEEIVVTAQKREEGLQDTPIAVTAFTNAALENKNIENIAQLADFTPNFIFDTTSPVPPS